MADKKKYCIEKTRYYYVPAGTDEKGRTIFEKVGEPQKSFCKDVNNFSDLKKQLYSQTKDRKDVFVNYEEPTYRIQKQRAKIQSVVQTKPDGSKFVTYYKAVQCK